MMKGFQVAIIILVSFLMAHFAHTMTNPDKAQYQTNLAKFEVMYEKCMGHKKGTVSECKDLAEFKSKTCVTGCE